MAFDVKLKSVDGIVTITISGELDRKVASSFQEKVEEAIKLEPKALVLDLKDLEYMASAGLRVIIFAKQHISKTITLYVVGAQELVADTIIKTGFDQSIVMLPEYDAAIIEK